MWMFFRNLIGKVVWCLLIGSTIIGCTPEPTREKAELKNGIDWLLKRQQDWLNYNKAKRGKGSTETTCLCCHTTVPFALSQSWLSIHQPDIQHSAEYLQILQDITTRVGHWDSLDTNSLQVMYDSSKTKNAESKATEAILNALALSFSPSNLDKTILNSAFDNMWLLQRNDGEQSGSWPWLDFDLEPWESRYSVYLGAAFAALAVRQASEHHQYSTSNIEPEYNLLITYLQQNYQQQSIYYQLWVLLADGGTNVLLKQKQINTLLSTISGLQQKNGQWHIGSLGQTNREIDPSDTYGTAFTLFVLKQVGITGSFDEHLAKRWLEKNQRETGRWLAWSQNKRRNIHTHRGKFMSDAATTFAIMALTDLPQ